MRFDSLANKSQGFLARVGHTGAPGQVGHVCPLPFSPFSTTTTYLTGAGLSTLGGPDS